MGKLIVSNLGNTERVVNSRGIVSFERVDGFSDNISLKYDEDTNLSKLVANDSVSGSALASLVNAVNNKNKDKRPITVDPSVSYYVAYNGENKIDGPANSIIFNKRTPESSIDNFDTSGFLTQ